MAGQLIPSSQLPRPSRLSTLYPRTSAHRNLFTLFAFFKGLMG
jgi:hypothetical protein